jgi:hypothetical protein
MLRELLLLSEQLFFQTELQKCLSYLIDIQAAADR